MSGKSQAKQAPLPVMLIQLPREGSSRIAHYTLGELGGFHDHFSVLGIGHERFTFRFQGRQFRLTDMHGHVVKPVLA